MTNGKGSALGIIAIVVGASGLGIGIFSAIKFEIVEGPQGPSGLDGLDGDDGLNGTLNNLVAIWESVIGVATPATSFYIALEDIRLNESEYFFQSLSNTSVNLTRSGWYRFNIRFLWTSLMTGGPYYALDIYKNGVAFEYIERVAATTDIYHLVKTSVYVYSDGDDYFRFRCATSGPAFDIHATQKFNQVVLEYVGES